MSGLGSALGYMAAGAAQGFGEGVAAKAESDRRAALEEARARREEIMLQRRQAFEAEQNQIQRDFTLERDAAGREHDLMLQDRQDARSAASRGPRRKFADTYVGTDGKTYGITYDGTVEMLKDADGNPAAPRRGGGDSDAVTLRQREKWVLDRAAELSTNDMENMRDALPYEDALKQARRELDMSLGRPAVGGGASDPVPASAPADGAAPRPPAQPMPEGDTPPAGEIRPAKYPDAIWSEKVGGWVVLRDGKWNRIR